MDSDSRKEDKGVPPPVAGVGGGWLSFGESVSLGALVATEQICLIATDDKGLIKVFNRGSEKLLGYDSAEVVDRFRLENIHLESQLVARARKLSEKAIDSASGFEVVIRSGEEGSYNWIYVRKDGAQVWVSLTVIPFGAKGTCERGFLFVAGDVSDRRIFESRLRESEERFRGAFDASGIGMAIVGLDGRWLEVNQSVCDIVGYPREGLLELTFQDITHPDDLDADVSLVEETLAGKLQNYRMVKRYYHADGSVIWVNLTVSLVRRGDGEPLYFVSQIEDITERHKLQRDLETTQERLGLATRAGGVGIWDWNIEEDILTWDDQMFALYGVRSTDFSGAYEAWTQKIHQEDRDRVDQEIQASIQGEGEFDTEFRVVCPDGEIRHLRALSTLRRRPDGVPFRMVGTNWDITVQVRQKEDLILYAQKANQANETKSQFLANMSHEIRTPMNGVIGMAHLLMDTVGVTSEQKQIAETIRSSGESLMSLINDILDFSKVESGKLELEELDFDLRKVMSEVAAILSVKANEKSLDFNCVADPEISGKLIGDPGRLRQILLNLAGNAIKFTSEGRVRVEAEFVESDASKVTIRFSVRDTGIGIDPDIQKDLFNAFTQADASTTRLYGGTGLGLAISKQLVGLMGGEIGIHSEEGVGSEFWFTVKLAIQQRRRLVDIDTGEFMGVRILVVDDNHEILRYIEELLASWDVESTSCATGVSALDTLYHAQEKGRPFDVAIVDAEMPRMDGLALARTIRSEGKFGSIRLVVLAEMVRVGELESTLGRLFDAIVTKPVRASDLHDSLAISLKPNSRMGAIDFEDRLHRLSQYDAKILLAEDNSVNQMVARGILSRFGMSVDTVANGVEAVEAVESGGYDLVLMDVQMPKVDGFEATRKIRLWEKSSNRERLPIIAMTAHARREDRERCLDSGMDDYVSKPIALDELAVVLEKWLLRSEKCPDSSPGSTEAKTRHASIFDKRDLRARLFQDESMIRMVLVSAIKDCRSQLEELVNAIRRKDARDACLRAHSIKGSSSSAAFVKLSQTAAEIELRLEEGNLTAAENRIPLLSRLIEESAQAVEAYISENLDLYGFNSDIED